MDYTHSEKFQQIAESASNSAERRSQDRQLNQPLAEIAKFEAKRNPIPYAINQLIQKSVDSFRCFKQGEDEQDLDYFHRFEDSHARFGE